MKSFPKYSNHSTGLVESQFISIPHQQSAMFYLMILVMIFHLVSIRESNSFRGNQLFDLNKNKSVANVTNCWFFDVILVWFIHAHLDKQTWQTFCRTLVPLEVEMKHLGFANNFRANIGPVDSEQFSQQTRTSQKRSVLIIKYYEKWVNYS